MRRYFALLAAISILFVFVGSGAQAMPASPLKGVSKATHDLTPVAGRCGRGFHRGPRGRCRPN